MSIDTGSGELADEAEQRLVQTEQRTVLGYLVPGIAHELNTPLGVIISNLSVLVGYGEAIGRLVRQAGLSDKELDYMLEDLPALTSESTASANRIAEIVRSVSMFAQSGSRDMGPLSIEESLDAAVALALTQIKHRATIVRAFAGVAPVVGNASELTQVFVHLLLGAAQALDERGGVVTVTTANEGAEVAVRIADNGHGIPAESLAHAFEPSFTARPIGDGTGLGLAVCHAIVTRHGGTIAIESVPGGDTTVTVRLAAASGRLQTAA